MIRATICVLFNREVDNLEHSSCFLEENHRFMEQNSYKLEEIGNIEEAVVFFCEEDDEL